MLPQLGQEEIKPALIKRNGCYVPYQMLRSHGYGRVCVSQHNAHFGLEADLRLPNHIGQQFSANPSTTKFRGKPIKHV